MTKKRCRMSCCAVENASEGSCQQCRLFRPVAGTGALYDSSAKPGKQWHSRKLSDDDKTGLHQHQDFRGLTLSGTKTHVKQRFLPPDSFNGLRCPLVTSSCQREGIMAEHIDTSPGGKAERRAISSSFSVSPCARDIQGCLHINMFHNTTALVTSPSVPS